MWKKKMDDLSAAWEKEYQQLRKEYSEILASLKNEIGDLNKKIAEYNRDYEKAVRDLKAKYAEEARKLADEIRTKYENDRKELEAAAEELRDAKERYDNTLAELEEFQDRIESAAQTIENEYENATRLLKEDVDRRCDRIFLLIDEAKKDDPRLDEHSLGEVTQLMMDVSGIRYESESDRYYHYSEMLMLGRELSDMVNRVYGILERAKAVRKKDDAMTEIKQRIDGHLEKKYTIYSRKQEKPWETYVVTFYDANTVYRLFADERAFNVEVWPSKEDKNVRKERERAIRNEIGELYGDQPETGQKHDRKTHSENDTEQQTEKKTGDSNRKEAY